MTHDILCIKHYTRSNHDCKYRMTENENVQQGQTASFIYIFTSICITIGKPSESWLTLTTMNQAASTGKTATMSNMQLVQIVEFLPYRFLRLRKRQLPSKDFNRNFDQTAKKLLTRSVGVNIQVLSIGQRHKKSDSVVVSYSRAFQYLDDREVEVPFAAAFSYSLPNQRKTKRLGAKTSYFFHFYYLFCIDVP